MNHPPELLRILDQARWAPSGDNTQPWRFQIVDSRHVIVRAFDTREHCVYDLDGHPSQISMGAMLETAAIAASTQGLSLEATRRPGAPENRPIFDLRFFPDANIAADPLAEFIERRSVQRRPFSTQPLTTTERRALEQSVDPQYRVLWIADLGGRLKTARMLFHSARLRLTIREAYEVHRDIIEWNARFSTDRVPDQALGADPMTTRLMRFAMQSWERIQFMNRFMAGTWAPRIQLDFIPGLACASHFVIYANEPPRNMDDYVAAGRSMQRFWLTATSLGLQLQPEVTPLVFARYAREGRTFSEDPSSMPYAKDIQNRLQELLGNEVATCAAFMGRVGKGKTAAARSLRRPLSQLIRDGEAEVSESLTVAIDDSSKS